MTPFEERIKKAINDGLLANKNPDLIEEVMAKAAAEVAVEKIKEAYREGYFDGETHQLIERDIIPADTHVRNIDEYLIDRGIISPEESHQQAPPGQRS
jgi:hypothetical protein